MRSVAPGTHARIHGRLYLGNEPRKTRKDKGEGETAIAPDLSRGRGGSPLPEVRAGGDGGAVQKRDRFHGAGGAAEAAAVRAAIFDHRLLLRGAVGDRAERADLPALPNAGAFVRGRLRH